MELKNVEKGVLVEWLRDRAKEPLPPALHPHNPFQGKYHPGTINA